MYLAAADGSTAAIAVVLRSLPAGHERGGVATCDRHLEFTNRVEFAGITMPNMLVATSDRCILDILLKRTNTAMYYDQRDTLDAPLSCRP